MTLSKRFDTSSHEWRELKELLTQRKVELITRLIAKDDAEVRGRIKQIDEVLKLDEKVGLPIEDDSPIY